MPDTTDDSEPRHIYITRRPTSVDLDPDIGPASFDLKQAQALISEASWVNHGELGEQMTRSYASTVAVYTQALAGWAKATILDDDLRRRMVNLNAEAQKIKEEVERLT